jgi:hypothetical protein
MYQLDERQAFDAMRHFLQAYEERGGEVTGIALLLVFLDINEANETVDPALWHDWLDAIEATVGPLTQ